MFNVIHSFPNVLFIVMDHDGVVIHFLHRESHIKITESSQINNIFKFVPNGVTPIVPVLKKFYNTPCTGKRLISLVMDGERNTSDGKRT